MVGSGCLSPAKWSKLGKRELALALLRCASEGVDIPFRPRYVCLRNASTRWMCIEEPELEMTESAEPSPFPSAQYSFSLKGPGVSIERQVDEEVACQLMHIAMGGPHSAMPVQHGSIHRQSNQHDASPKLSLREFLLQAQPKRNPDKITAIAVFMKRHDGVGDFAREEILAKYRQAGEQTPSNFHRDFNWALKAGFLAEDPVKHGRFYVTGTGETAVSSQFPAEMLKSTGLRKGVRQRKRKGRDSQSEDGASPDRRSGITRGISCRARIAGMQGEGFFAQPRTAGEVAGALRERATPYQSNAVAAALNQITQNRTLRRYREDGKWRYVNP
jgi:hypothetical protein